MRSLMLKLLALIAYLAMPFTMSAAMSAPMPAAPHHEMAMAEMPGCPGQEAPGIDPTAFVGCAMMCAALPTVELGDPEPLLLAAAPPALAVVRGYSGIHLEIATPPPRRA